MKIGAVDPVTRMHILKCARHANGAPVGDIVPLCSIGVLVGRLPCTLDTIKSLLKHELEFCIIHEGANNLELIKYNRAAGPPAYSKKGWAFNCSKQIKQSEESEAELEDNEGSDTEIDGDTIEDEDSDADDSGGAKLNYEGSLRSYHLRNMLKDDIPYKFVIGAWYWTAEFSTTAIQDKFNAQKPDLSLFNFTLLKNKKSWANILAFVEHTSSDLSKN
ncbi:hypothetical protein F4604DRAFT_1673177 [Suillus subluteus]|nr:hypothetical protein F4604DRAFT_1673177 [Suillus subluteus]